MRALVAVERPADLCAGLTRTYNVASVLISRIIYTTVSFDGCSERAYVTGAWRDARDAPTFSLWPRSFPLAISKREEQMPRAMVRARSRADARVYFVA